MPEPTEACPTVVVVVDGGLRFSATLWGHVLEVLAVSYGYTTRVTHQSWSAILDAYAAVWADVMDRAALEAPDAAPEPAGREVRRCPGPGPRRSR